MQIVIKLTRITFPSFLYLMFQWRLAIYLPSPKQERKRKLSQNVKVKWIPCLKMSTLEGTANGIVKFKLNFLSIRPESLASNHDKEETRQQFRLCDFLAACRDHHLEVEIGAHFKCLGGSCSHLCIPLGFNPLLWGLFSTSKCRGHHPWLQRWKP